MAKQIVATQPGASFEYELLEDDPDYLRTVAASSSRISPWIEPSKLKLRHRIGRGPFGDVWLATHHQSTKDYDEFHEVAVKMLLPIKEEHTRALLDKFEDLFSKCQGAGGVCLLHGVSIISGKVEYLYLMHCGEIVLSDIKVAK
jgi:hypothetical protein